MIDSKQVAKIKEYQRDFEDTFGKRLEIDWNTMKGHKRRIITYRHDDIDTSIDPLDLLKESVDKYGASLQKLKNRKNRVHTTGNSKERMALIHYCRAVLESRVNVGEAAKLINRDRTLIYYFAAAAKP